MSEASFTQGHENDLISRQAAIEATLYATDGDFIAQQTVVEALEALPSAEPEIIRCRNCKYWYSTDGKVGTCEREIWTEDGQYKMRSEEWEDDFCSHAESEDT